MQELKAVKAVSETGGHKEYKYLYRRMLDDEVIRLAYKKLRKGKTKRKEIIYIDEHLDEEVEKMRVMIQNTKPPGTEGVDESKAYKPCKRTPKIIFEHGKHRKIYMPEIHEQWLHHIIVLILEPIVMATAYPYSCGSFPKRGAHYGKRRLEYWIRKGEGIKYFGKIDIRHFYDSVRIDVLMKELGIRIKDDWFLYIIRLCLKGFKKGIPLGFYISQWIANYILEPLDKFVTEVLCLEIFVRYMDDMTFFADNKKTLRKAIAEVMVYIGRRFRLKLKRNHQVSRFDFVKRNGAKVGRPLDYMGFLFFRCRTTLRKSIMLAGTRMAAKLKAAKDAGRGYFVKDIQAMLSYMGWFTHADAYGCYLEYIKPMVSIRKLRNILSKISKKRRDGHDRLDTGTLCIAA